MAIGIIETAHGIRGDVKIKPLTDFPDRFKRLSSVHVHLKNGEVRELVLRKVSITERVIYLSFQGVETRDQAFELRGATLKIPERDLIPLETDEFYHFEIIDFEVKTTAGEYLGKVVDVIALSANDVLSVRREQKEYLIPVIKDVIRQINKNRGEIIIEPVDGLLEIN